MIFCLVHLVGYAPQPNDVANEVHRCGILALAGNDKGIGLASSAGRKPKPAVVVIYV